MKKIILMMSLSLTFSAGAWSAESPVCSSDDPIKKIEDAIKGSNPNGRTFKDFQENAIDYSKVDAVLASKLQELNSASTINVKKLSAGAPDYRLASSKLRKAMAEGLAEYVQALGQIQKNTADTLSPFYSRLKALKEAAANDNTGAMKATYETELRRLTQAVDELQKKNQGLYDNSIVRMKNIGMNPENLDKGNFYSRKKSDLVPEINFRGVDSTPEDLNNFPTLSHVYSWGKGGSINIKKVTLSCNLSHLTYEQAYIYYYGRHLSSFAEAECKKQAMAQLKPDLDKMKEEFEKRFAEEDNGEGVAYSSPLQYCKTVACTKVIEQDLQEWVTFVEKIAQPISMEKVLEGPKAFQEKHFWLSSPKPETYGQSLSGALLKFAKQSIESPTITPNQEHNVPDLGLSILAKGAKAGIGVGSAMLAAPALVLDGVAAGAMKLAKLLDNRYVVLSLDLKPIDIDDAETRSRYARNMNILAQNLPAAIFEETGTDDDPFKNNLAGDKNATKTCAAVSTNTAGKIAALVGSSSANIAEYTQSAQ